MKIKKEPEHFFVKEISKLKIQDEGEYAYVLLRKRNYTTQRAISAVSRVLRVSRKRIGVAGNKDKSALTEQIVSIWKAKKEDIEKVELKDIELEFLGYSDERITLGDLEGNFFKIQVFCEKGDETNIKVLEKRAEILIKQGFLNYFGEQRFGISKNNHEIGRFFLKGDFENALKGILIKTGIDNKEINDYSEFVKKNWGNWKECINKVPRFMSMEKSILNHLIKYSNDFAGAFRVLPKNLRRIFIHAYQSWIWNKALSNTVSGKEFICVADMKLNTGAGEFSEEKLPLIGFNSEDDGSYFFNESLKILKKEGLSLEDFKLPRMPELASKGDFREVRAFPKKLSIRKKEKDSFLVSFELGKGSYATVLLKNLFFKPKK